MPEAQGGAVSFPAPPGTLRDIKKRILRLLRPSVATRDPIRGELFSIERLEQHAETLASTHKTTLKPSQGQAILPRVKENGRILAECRRSLSRTVREERDITPAAEWLLDNFHLVDDQVREIIDDLPPGFYRMLPKLSGGDMAGYPRVLALAWDFVAHTDSRFDPAWLLRFTRAYQRIDIFQIGEVWALAISLRIVLVENLRRLAEIITSTRIARQEADFLADAILGLKGPAPANPMELLHPFEEKSLERGFVVQLVQRLREQNQDAAPVLQWLDARLAAQGVTADEIVRTEHQAQAAMNATVRNIITSMRLVSGLDWAQFFEDTAAVDQILRANSAFSAMDFPTRDSYRHAIEEISRGSGVPEAEVARRAVQAAVEGGNEREKDPGYHLISGGRLRLEKALLFRPSLRLRLARACRRYGAPLYLGSIAAATMGLLGAAVIVSAHQGAGALPLIAWALLGLIPASDLAVAVVNRFVTETIKPRLLPKLDFSGGIPRDFPTLVVMPVLFVDIDGVNEYIERLEIHFLSNPDGHITFGLLSDWVDSPQERMPEDDSLLETARQGIRRLNERHGPGPGNTPRFRLYHRRRLWNADQGVWMGWERKRGKLHELNRRLRGDAGTSFIEDPNEKDGAPKIFYVITLDADTRISIGAAYRLAGAMAHPLNRPKLEEGSTRIAEGYAVMQPRITPTLPMTGVGSLYQKIHSGPSGIDPYAFAVSDVYQDLFGEGSYIGKGIYDVDAFEASLRGRVPENKMLSHDLFEGLHARTALLTDVEFFEEFPVHEEISRARAHRWTRGDWQLLPWIFGRVPRPLSAGYDSPLPAIARWKMIDNLRRSLSAPAAFLGLLCAAAWNHPLSALWAAFIAGTISGPPLLSVLVGFLFPFRKNALGIHLRALNGDFRLALSQIILAFIFLPRQACVMSDAIFRTIHRLLFSRGKLLEWVSTAQTETSFACRNIPSSQRMLITPLIAGGLSAVTWSLETPAPWSSLIHLSLLWLLAPWMSARLRLPPGKKNPRPLSLLDRLYFRKIARKTWRYFETFVTIEHNFLPPDNFQEVPHPVTAGRTSPTNIGLYLLSIIAARDFGWIGLLETVERLEKSMATIASLKRHKGHLFNWYDTKDLRPLDPPYLSTVDSGNLAGHLWALGNACRALAVSPFPRGDVFAGIEDVLNLIEESAAGAGGHGRAGIVTDVQVRQACSGIRETLKTPPAGPSEWKKRLAGIRERSLVLIDITRLLASVHPSENRDEALSWSETLLRQIEGHARDAEEEDTSDLIRRLSALARHCDQTVQNMDFKPLFDPLKKIFSIGFQTMEEKQDSGHYDLLASEARLASYVAIAKGDVPHAHWFRLTRTFTSLPRGAALLSWSGSMFEYLMPSLVMRAPAGGLLENTCRGIIQRQIDYGKERGVPWGISESAYNVQNLEFSYQYSNFGVPGLGLKRGLSEDLLIAPYATALAASIDPTESAKNFRHLEKEGGEGRFGFYEALDYTPGRLPKNNKVAVVRAYMAHHQGMTLVSLDNTLHDGIMCSRFHAEPMVQAAELLLQEKLPRDIRVALFRPEESPGEARPPVSSVLRLFHTPHESPPRTHLLSNGSYSVMLTAAGSGFSRWKNLAVTRWREDPTRDAYGTYVFLRDAGSGAVWSAGFQPSGVEPESYDVDFSEERAKITRKDGSLVTTLEVVVSSEDDAEVRRVTIKNLGNLARDVELTSYAEIVLAAPAADLAHPAFSNLFVRTEFAPEVNAILCTRRPRVPGEESPWAAHVAVVEGVALGPLQYETDRARFLGRNRDPRAPMCVMDGMPLSNTVGAVLDPIVSLRREVRLNPGETARITFTTLIAASRQEALALADKYHDPAMFERTVTLAWTQAQIQRHHLGMAAGEIHLFQELAGRILHSSADFRPPAGLLQLNTRGPSGLWVHGLSGDLPIVLIRIDELEDRGIIRDILRAHEYWHMKGLEVDLVILNEKPPSYNQDLQNSLEALVRARQTAHRHEMRAGGGGIFVLRADRLLPEDILLLQTSARIVLLSRRGTLARQVERMERRSKPIAVSPPPRKPATPLEMRSGDAPSLQFFNGLGGFSPDGREYVTILGPGQWTPAPWINVIANPSFGFQVSESGSGHVWSLNSRENRITPWSNDPVGDPPGEVFYFRDEETGELWTPTALPIREQSSLYTVRHGQGYSRFEYLSHGIEVDLLQFVPLEDPVKISRLTITNRSERPRRISITAYIEWVLGNERGTSTPYIVTEIDERSGAMLARNPWNGEFGSRVAFADFSGKQSSWTGDRAEFLGRNAVLRHPSALAGNKRLSGAVGAGLDPCASLQTIVFLRPGEEVHLDFFLGQGSNRSEALEILQRCRAADLKSSFEEVRNRWERDLSTVQVSTPDRAMDIMLNHWLLYQTLACRLLARTGFYQGGGAYGFRDQLQDVMALAVPRRDITREHILRAAGRQFHEGDVQHWWHPPSGRGVRTRIADDPTWLVYTVLHYLEVTGDAGILDELIPFLEGEPLSEGKEDAYFLPKTSPETASLFEHCARALEHSLAVGAHGLPFIGAGDWNDGMNRVGAGGKGESVWMAWFLHTTLWEFAKTAESRGESLRAEKWRLHVGELKAAVERNGWDGDWYRRAYFDDGTPLGSATNGECRIDSIAQSWGVLSGAADPARAARAMSALEENLIRWKDGLVLLLTPPFDQTRPDPGYIQGYLPGVRENGGQYTHAAVWALMAFAAQGNGDKAGELFSLLNPIRHGSTRADIHRYKVEPYVTAADVYAEPPHVGRGGWTWYTGSSGWMYRAGIESILGFRLRGTTLFMDPCIPRSWPGFDLSFRYHSTRYEVKVENPLGISRGVRSTEMDGKAVRSGAPILLVDDGRVHQVRIVLG